MISLIIKRNQKTFKNHIDISEFTRYNANSEFTKNSKGGDYMASIMTVRAPDDLQKVLTEQAKKLGYPRNALVIQILRDWVERDSGKGGEG